MVERRGVPYRHRYQSAFVAGDRQSQCDGYCGEGDALVRQHATLWLPCSSRSVEDFGEGIVVRLVSLSRGDLAHQSVETPGGCRSACGEGLDRSIHRRNHARERRIEHEHLRAGMPKYVFELGGLKLVVHRHYDGS